MRTASFARFIVLLSSTKRIFTRSTVLDCSYRHSPAKNLGWSRLLLAPISARISVIFFDRVTIGYPPFHQQPSDLRRVPTAENPQSRPPSPNAVESSLAPKHRKAHLWRRRPSSPSCRIAGKCITEKRNARR